MRKYKCYGSCGEKYDKTMLAIHAGKNYCQSCYLELIEEKSNMEVLYNLIRRIYSVTFPTAMHLGQIKRLKGQGYKYRDLVLAANYYIKNGGKRLNANMGFGYISNCIEVALHEVKKTNDINEKNMFEKVDDNITIISTKVEIENKYKKSKIINLEDIL